MPQAMRFSAKVVEKPLPALDGESLHPQRVREPATRACQIAIWGPQFRG